MAAWRRARLAATMLVVAALFGCSKVDAPPPPPPPVEAVPEQNTTSPQPQPAEGGGSRPEKEHETAAAPGVSGPIAIVAAPTIGSGAVDVPGTMQAGRESIARLVVSPGDLASLLRAGGVANPVGASSAIQLTPRMRATLIAPESDIAPTDAQEQAVQVGQPTTWVWTIVPRQAGKITLVFTLEGLVTVDGRQTAVRPPAWTVPVRVEVDSWLFFEDNWKWLATAIVIPLVAFFGKRWLDRRAKGRRR